MIDDQITFGRCCTGRCAATSAAERGVGTRKWGVQQTGGRQRRERERKLVFERAEWGCKWIMIFWKVFFIVLLAQRVFFRKSSHGQRVSKTESTSSLANTKKTMQSSGSHPEVKTCTFDMSEKMTFVIAFVFAIHVHFGFGRFTSVPGCVSMPRLLPGAGGRRLPSWPWRSGERIAGWQMLEEPPLGGQNEWDFFRAQAFLLDPFW